MRRPFFTSQRFRILLWGFLAVLGLSAVAVGSYSRYILGKIQYIDPTATSMLSQEALDHYTEAGDRPIPEDTPLAPYEIILPTQEALETEANVINILLIGQDRQSGEVRARSDTILLCTLDTREKTLTMTSFLRDLYVAIPGYRSNRINAAYTAGGMDQQQWNDDLMGMLSCTILAKERDDFPIIREECERRMAEYNKIISENNWEFFSRNRPYDQEQTSISLTALQEPDVTAHRRQQFVIFAILLLVPAINISSMTQSRLRQRVSEIGVRRAFGSTRTDLMLQILAENFIVTMIAGVLGLLLSVVCAYVGNDFLFAQPQSQTLNPPVVDASILLQPDTFLWALFFCFVLNLLSSGIPAWRASRIGIVNALGGRLH